MIDIHELFEATLRATSEQAADNSNHYPNNSTASSLLCTVIQHASTLTIAAAAASTPHDTAMCRSESLAPFSPLAAVSKVSSPFNCPSTEPTPISVPPTLSSFPYPSFLAHFFSRHEPLIFCNFDINPNTSVFVLTFIAATMLQITGFYLFRYFVPHLAQGDKKSRRGLSWVLTLFSSMVLFTGTFTLSSNMEWRPAVTGGPGAARAEGLAGDIGGSRILLSMRNFPQESDLATMYSAYFVSYLICDLALGILHYRAYLDPLSGWFHHLGYLGVVSNATLQKNVSTMFAMGTPIEVSTIFLASGHIFPKLRSDFLFATSFFISRIVYPIVLLPELYLNVESRLCWKVGLMALTIHVHWFRKFFQQQLRYYRARKDHHGDLKSSVAENESQESKMIDIKKADGRVYEYPPTQILKAKVVMPEKKNAMSAMGEATVNEVEINRSRRQPKVTLRISSRTPSFEHDIESRLCDQDEEDSDTDADADAMNDTAAIVTTATAAPAKTMQQLLDECENEDFSSYALPIHGKGPSKTFSAMAVKRLMSSQGAGGASGAVRLSRPSSMRDTKRRIALDAVRFENPKEVETMSRVTKTTFAEKHQVDGEATVVLRHRPSRSSVIKPSSDSDFEFGTVRVPRGVSIHA